MTHLWQVITEKFWAEQTGIFISIEECDMDILEVKQNLNKTVYYSDFYNIPGTDTVYP